MLRRCVAARMNASARAAFDNNERRVSLARRVLGRAGDWLWEENRIDKLARYVEHDARFDLHPSFGWTLDSLTLGGCLVVFYAIWYGHITPSRFVLVSSGFMTEERYSALWELADELSVRALQCLFFFFIFRCHRHVKYPVAAHVLAPLWRAAGLVTDRYRERMAAEAGKDAATQAAKAARTQKLKGVAGRQAAAGAKRR